MLQRGFTSSIRSPQHAGTTHSLLCLRRRRTEWRGRCGKDCSAGHEAVGQDKWDGKFAELEESGWKSFPSQPCSTRAPNSPRRAACAPLAGAPVQEDGLEDPAP